MEELGEGEYGQNTLYDSLKELIKNKDRNKNELGITLVTQEAFISFSVRLLFFT